MAHGDISLAIDSSSATLANSPARNSAASEDDVSFAHELYFETRYGRKFADLKLEPEKSLKEINIHWDGFAKVSENENLPLLPIGVSCDLGSRDEIEPEILHLLPISQDISKKNLEEGASIEMQGLILCRDDTTGNFRRVGAFDTHAPYLRGSNEEFRMRLLKVPETELTII